MVAKQYWISSIVGIFFGCLAAAVAAEPSTKQAHALSVYVGTYTKGQSKGIYLCHFDLATGKLSPPSVAGETANPSFLAVHPRRPFLYAVGEMGSFEGKKSGAVSAFSIDPQSGDLTLLNQQASGGVGPCHLAVDHTGRCLVVANYGSGSVACLPLEQDGRLGGATSVIQHEGSSVNQKRQQGPHAHGVYLDAANRYVFVPDLGLDKIMIYRLDAEKARLTAHDPAWTEITPGSGPRHLALHPTASFAYVINELSSTVTALAYDAPRGTLAPLQTVSTLPDGFSGTNTCAEVFVHPSGRFLYGSNRGHNSIAAFAIDAGTGKLRPLTHQATQGKNPRNFAIDPSGKYLLAANQDSDDIVAFQIDPQSGKLTATGEPIRIPSPVCILVLRPLR